MEVREDERSGLGLTSDLDLHVNTRGHCFICLLRLETETEGSQLHSLHQLHSYLKVDLSKFHNLEDDGVPAPTNFLKVQRSPQFVKVPFCEGCASISDQFSEQYKQLRWIQMEISSSLKQIHQKMTSAEDTGLAEWFRIASESTSLTEGEGREDSLKFVEALREETMLKCSGKLNVLLPQVQVQKLNMEEFNAKRRKIKSSFKINALSSINIKVEPSDVILDIPSPPMEDDDDRDEAWNPAAADDFDDEPEPQPQHSPSKAIKRPSTSPLPSGLGLLKNAMQEMRKRSKAIKKQTKTSFISNATKDSETGRYKCNYCPKNFARAHAFINHYKEFHLNLKFDCTVCDKEFSSRTSFQRHLQNFHMGIRYKCEPCNRFFSLKSNLKLHQRMGHSSHANRKKVKGSPKADTGSAEMEGDVTSESQAVEEMAGKVKSEPKRPSQKTKKVEKTKSKRKRRNATPPDSEDDAGAPKNEPTEASQTIIVVIGGDSTDKVKPKMALPTITQLGTGTLEKTLNPETGKYKCSACPKEMNCFYSLQAHFSGTHLKRRFKCNECGKQFKFHQIYNRHYRTEHVRVTYVCYGCNQSFDRPSTIKQHQKETNCGAASKEAPIIQCHLCGKNFATERNLERHVKQVHLNLKEHVCEQCGKGFTSRQYLKLHVKSFHLKIRDQVCDLCGKELSSATHLKKHKQVVHFNELPASEQILLDCDFCDKQFPRRDYLRNHLKTHTGEKNYQCRYCQKTFSHSSNCKKHEANHQAVDMSQSSSSFM